MQLKDFNFTVEVRNRLKGLDLIDRVPEELWTEVHSIVQEAVTKTIPPKKRNARRQSGCLRRPYKQLEKSREVKGKEERERYSQQNAEFQRIARQDQKAFLSEQSKETEENNRMGKTRDLITKIIPRKYFMQRWA